MHFCTKRWEMERKRQWADLQVVYASSNDKCLNSAAESILMTLEPNDAFSTKWDLVSATKK